jgi:hypothetical protein
MSEMPNNYKARRDKSEKKKNKNGGPIPPEKQVPVESVESFLSRSPADSGFQEDDESFTWESATGETALDNSLSSFDRVSSSAEPRETRKEARARKIKEALEKELEDESDLTLYDDSSDKEDSAQRKLSLSPTQFLESIATGALKGSRAVRQRAMERPSALNAPIQVIEAK